MKKIGIILIIALFFLSGCAGFQITTTGSSDVSKAYTHGKAIGAGLALAYPDQVAVALPYAQGLLSVAKDGQITEAQVAKALTLVSEKLGGNASLKASLGIISTEIGLSVKTGTVNQNLVDALQGAVDGITTFKEVNKS